MKYNNTSQHLSSPWMESKVRRGCEWVRRAMSTPGQVAGDSAVALMVRAPLPAFSMVIVKNQGRGGTLFNLFCSQVEVIIP